MKNTLSFDMPLLTLVYLEIGGRLFPEFVRFYHTKWRHKPAASIVHGHSCKNFKSHVFESVYHSSHSRNVGIASMNIQTSKCSALQFKLLKKNLYAC
jgi:hypothetical protein